MDYSKHYQKLMDRGTRRREYWSYYRQGPRQYTENHRIIPGCMGGTYIESNTAWLTPEEHYIAHQLLVKIYSGNFRLVYAALWMTVSTPSTDRSKNKWYGWLKRRLAETPRPEVGDKLRGKPRSVECRNKLSAFRKGKTYEELLGEEQAKEQRLIKSAQTKGKTYEEIMGVDKANKLKALKSSQVKGKSYEERFGIEKAEQIKRKIRATTAGRKRGPRPPEYRAKLSLIAKNSKNNPKGKHRVYREDGTFYMSR